jgi:5-methylcytosine-specific restriction endonuclease McrA
MREAIGLEKEDHGRGGEAVNPDRRLRAKCVYCSREFKFRFSASNGLFCSNTCFQNERKARNDRNALESGRFSGSCQAKRFLVSKYGRSCMICGLTEWRGLPIPLVCDHIDGNSDNWSLDNCRMICCNCDAQTPTYKSKNKGNGRFSRRERYRSGLSF